METFVSTDKSYRKRLVNELIQRQRRNPAYSLRSFARDLSVSLTALSDVLNAKRNLSKANLLKIADKLSFSPSETEQALTEASGNAVAVSDQHFTLVQDDVFRFMSDWYYFAILSLAEGGHAKADPKWISSKFGIPLVESQDAMERLLRLRLVEVKRGQLIYGGKPLRTTTDIPSSAVRNLQHNHLRLAQASLEKDPINLRDMTSMTMATTPERITKAKDMIKNFRRKLTRYLEAEGGDEVYVLAVQLFPVTKKDGR